MRDLILLIDPVSLHCPEFVVLSEHSIFEQFVRDRSRFLGVPANGQVKGCVFTIDCHVLFVAGALKRGFCCIILWAIHSGHV